MKKLLLLGMIALGSMSFTTEYAAVEESGDCWSQADTVMVAVFLSARYHVTQDHLDNVWDAAFAQCVNAGGQETVVLTNK